MPITSKSISACFYFWQVFALLDPVPVTQTITLTDPLAPDRPTRFYRVRTR